MKHIAALLVLGLVSIGTLSAGPIQGTMTITALSATLLPSNNLDTATSITPVTFNVPSQVLAGLSSGNFTLIPPATIGIGGVVNLTSLNTFSISFAGYGTFTASSGSIAGRSPGFLDVSYVGTFTPAVGGPLANAGITAGATTLRLAMNQNGQTVSYNGTFSAAEIPEPSTFIFTGAALLGLLARKKIIR